MQLPDLPELPDMPDLPMLPDLPALPGEEPDTPDPLADVEYTGDLAEDSARELTALEQGYRARAKAEANRFRDATDSEYWFAVCFKTREEKEAFLKAARITLDMGDKYIRGAEFAHRLGVDY